MPVHICGYVSRVDPKPQAQMLSSKHSLSEPPNPKLTSLSPELEALNSELLKTKKLSGYVDMKGVATLALHARFRFGGNL